jgi:hypothetical protein
MQRASSLLTHYVFTHLVDCPSSATYIREPLASGRDRVDILLNNIRNATDPTSLTFEDIAAIWYFDLLLRGRYTNDSIGVDKPLYYMTYKSVSYFSANHLQQLNTPVAYAMYTAGD